MDQSIPRQTVSKKPAETRMGKGKGSQLGCVVKPDVLFEVAGVTEKQAREALRLASHKLPCKVRFVESEREFTEEEIAKFAEVQVLDIPDELLTDDELAEQAAEAEAAEGADEASGEAEAEADAE